MALVIAFSFLPWISFGLWRSANLPNLSLLLTFLWCTLPIDNIRKGPRKMSPCGFYIWHSQSRGIFILLYFVRFLWHLKLYKFIDLLPSLELFSEATDILKASLRSKVYMGKSICAMVFLLKRFCKFHSPTLYYCLFWPYSVLSDVFSCSMMSWLLFFLLLRAFGCYAICRYYFLNCIFFDILLEMWVIHD